MHGYFSRFSTRELALASILGAFSWIIKTYLPGIPVDFAIPGAKIDFGWTPAVLAALWLGIKGGLITGVVMSMVPIPTLYITGLLWTPWVLAATGYLAQNRRWGWRAAIVFPLLHVPIGCAIFTWVLPVFSFFAWPMVMPTIFLAEYTSVALAIVIAQYISRTSIAPPLSKLQTDRIRT